MGICKFYYEFPTVSMVFQLIFMSISIRVFNICTLEDGSLHKINYHFIS